MIRLATARVAILVAFIACALMQVSLYSDIPSQPEAEQVCIVSDKRINEASGLALSRRQSDAVWMHNDSGDVARLFLVGLDGATRGVFPVADLPMPLDWEDMCSFSVNGEPWLLIGDVGDNAFNRHIVAPDTGQERACRLYLCREPELKEGAEQEPVPVYATIIYEYEDGPHNCESVAVDTERGEILLVSKSKSTPLDCGVYSIPLTMEVGTTSVTAARIGSLDLRNATAMDIAPDNHRMVVITGTSGLVVERDAGESWGDAMLSNSRTIALPKRNGGETVCFTSNRDELFLNSEHVAQPLWRLKIPPLAAPTVAPPSSPPATGA